jgi:GT2 family glycosyltransferase
MKISSRIAVIIPTFNHPDQVIRAITSLQNQVFTDIQVIVVDNSGHDMLKSRIETFNRTAKFKVTYLQEPRLGLHYARHAGARYAAADILVFTDDDATFDPGWLDAYAGAFAEHPEMKAAGGPVRPIWEAQPPGWLLAYIGGAKIFPILSLMEPYQDFHLNSKGFFFGVNMAIRRNVLFNVGGFNPELIGAMTVGDGESGLNRKLQEKGFPIGYVPKAVVLHHIPRYRMTVKYIRKWAWHLGGANMYQKLRGRLHSKISLLNEFLKIVLKKGAWWLLLPIAWNRTDQLSIRIQLWACEAWCSINYLWWAHRNAQIKQYLVQQNFLIDQDDS